MKAKVSEIDAIPLASAYSGHATWWDSFWNRSWIFITGDAAATSAHPDTGPIPVARAFPAAGGD